MVESVDLMLNKRDEGTVVTLHAKENKAETNPFICWIKDNSKIVGTEKELSLTYTASTEGNYTAIFHENQPSKMMFASLSKVSVLSSDNSSYDNVEYSIKTGFAGLDINTMPDFATGEFSLSDRTQESNNLSILYFGSADRNYLVQATLKLKGCWILVFYQTN